MKIGSNSMKSGMDLQRNGSTKDLYSSNRSQDLFLEPLLNGFNSDIQSSIFIRDSYLTMFDTVWAQAIKSRGSHGLVVNGQTGVGAYVLSHIRYLLSSIVYEGKTLFNCYLLVRLLQRKQVVLFSLDGEELFLFYFYFGEVYEALASEVKRKFPEPKSSSGVFIWSLFDIAEEKEPMKHLYNSPCFPVQTASHDPMRYKTWVKERTPLMVGLPVWTRDELAQGYVLQITHLSMSERTLSRLKYHKFYPSLMDALCQVSSNPNVLVDSYAEDAINFLKERRIEEGLDIVSSPNDALDYLLDAAIDRFGYSARDVFGAVFNYGWHTLYHEEAFHAFT